MKTLNDENTGAVTTEILDPKGNLLIKFTREYGAAIPTSEIIEIEKGLLAMGEQLREKLG